MFQTFQTGNFKIKTVCFLSWNTVYFCNTEWCLWKLLFSLRSRPAWNKLLNFLETEDTLDQVSGNKEFFTWNRLGYGDIHKQLNFSFLDMCSFLMQNFSAPSVRIRAPTWRPRTNSQSHNLICLCVDFKIGLYFRLFSSRIATSLAMTSYLYEYCFSSIPYLNPVAYYLLQIVFKWPIVVWHAY